MAKKNITILERRELKDFQGYMTLFHDHDAKESYWVKYDNQGYDIHGFNMHGYNAQGFDAYGFDRQGLNVHGFDHQGVQVRPPLTGDYSFSDDHT